MDFHKPQKIRNGKYWARVATQGKDTHLIIGNSSDKGGEHSHLISDSSTGELRIDREDKNPRELISKVVSVTTKSGEGIVYKQDSVKTTLEFDNGNNAVSQSTPILLPSIGGKSGGPDGHIINFKIKNISNFPAFNIHISIKGFGSEWRSNDLTEILANQENEVIYLLSSDKPFKKLIPELAIYLGYEDMNGNRVFTKRELRQQLVPSGSFYDLEPSSFSQPKLLPQNIVEVVTEPFKTGDKVEMAFKVKAADVIYQTTIGISGSLVAVFRFEDDAQVRQAIIELADRKIRQMLIEAIPTDYLFTDHDLKGPNINGFEAYKLLRDSIG